MYFFPWENVSAYNPGSPETSSGYKAGLELAQLYLPLLECVGATHGLSETLNRENCNLLSYDWGNLVSARSTVTIRAWEESLVISVVCLLFGDSTHCSFAHACFVQAEYGI